MNTTRSTFGTFLISVFTFLDVLFHIFTATTVLTSQKGIRTHDHIIRIDFHGTRWDSIDRSEFTNC